MIKVLQNNLPKPVKEGEWTFQPFELVIKRNSLGLGLSIMGGPDAPSPFTNLIRIKKIFPLQPAWETGRLNEGDILLSAGGVPLSSLTVRQALDVLRSSHAGPVTRLTVCKSPPDNHPRQIFDHIFQLNSTTEIGGNKQSVPTSESTERPRIIHRSYSSCVTTANNSPHINGPDVSMIKCGTPSKEPLSISTVTNHKSTTTICPILRTKPARTSIEKISPQTNVRNCEENVSVRISKSGSDVIFNSKGNRSSSPMDYEDDLTSGHSVILDDSVQSFTQSNGANGPVYVDNSPERDNDNNDELEKNKVNVNINSGDTSCDNGNCPMDDQEINRSRINAKEFIGGIIATIGSMSP